MRMIKGFIILSAVLGMVSCVFAQETVEKGSAGKHGIRIAVRNHPGIDEWVKEYGGVEDTYKQDEQSGIQLDVMYAKRFLGKDGKNMFGGQVGGGLFLATTGGEDEFSEVDMMAFGFLFEGGGCAQFGDLVILEVTPFMGIGGAGYDITDKTGFVDYSAGGGAYLQYGIKGGVFFMLGDNIELGVELGYSAFDSYSEINYSNFGGPVVDVTMSGDGFQGALVLGVKF